MEQKIPLKVQDNQLMTTSEFESLLEIVACGQAKTSKQLDDMRNELHRGFLGIALRNDQLLTSNDQLKEQLDEVLKELSTIKQEREERAARKQARANRKRLPKRDPMTSEIYKKLIKTAEGPTYLHVRTRIAICILAVTGIWINELLPLKVSQLETLVKENWIAIDRSKRGPSNHKAFLNKEGKNLLKERKKDFQILFLMKEPDSYVFSSEKDDSKHLRREAITKDVNKVMRLVSKQLPGQPNITSHSFRIGYITQLWKDTKDIEFVKQTIGHRNLDTTSAYVNQLSDHERKNRIDQLE